MISYSTVIPLKEGATVEDVLVLGYRWISGSPFSSISRDVLVLPDVDDETLIESSPEQVSTILVDIAGTKHGGLRYVTRDNEGIEWITSLGCARIDDQVQVGLQISCEKSGAVPKLPSARKPYLVKLLLTEIGGGNDGEVPVTDRAIPLAPSHARVAAALIKGEGSNRLPIVYLSAKSDGKYAVDPDHLARWVSGTAHVVSEPGASFSSELTRLVGKEAVYGGNVGVYWPDGGKRWNRFLKPGEDPKQLAFEISRLVRSALVNSRLPTELGWLYLREQLAKRKIDNIKAKGSRDFDEFAKAFDEEIKAKQDRIDELEISLAKAIALTGRTDSESGGLIKRGGEADLFENETTDLVIDAIDHYQQYVPTDSRRSHILSSLLEENTKTDRSSRIEDEIKSALRAYRSMDRSTRKTLEEAGFTITDDGKHYKAVYHDDGRYTFSVAKTAGDHRAGMNLAGEISRKVL